MSMIWNYLEPQVIKEMGDLQKASYLIIFFYRDDREITLIKDQLIKILNLILQWTEKESTEHQAFFFSLRPGRWV